MSTGNVHLIVTCTRRKTVPAGDAVFPDERDLERAYGLWLERLVQGSSSCSAKRCRNVDFIRRPGATTSL